MRASRLSRWMCATSALVLMGCAAHPPPLARSSSSKQARADPAMRACTAPTDCVVRPRTCCGDCGAATPRDSIALNASWLRQHRYSCTGGTGCPDCHRERDPRLAATCRAGQCAVLNLGSPENARCTQDDECVLRAATCCECGARWIAIRRDRAEAVTRALCGRGPSASACPACAPEPPRGPARCVDHRCVAPDAL